ncbi:MAG: FecR domain-containing protein [Steroidobacteraceae bacterium]
MGSNREIERAAAAWLARREREECGDADEVSLGEWLSASVAHRVAFVRLEAAWAQTGHLKALSATGYDALLRAPRPQASPSGVPPAAPDASGAQPRRLALIAIAAAVLIASTVGAVWLETAHSGASYRTAVGVIKAVPMKDGSTITLNTDSDIRVALSDKERRVDLDKGEAFFEVAKDLNRPFVVRVDDERVIAVGTKFSVRREADHVRVIVTEGHVRVERTGAQQQTAAALLSKGSVAIAGAAGVLVQDETLSAVEERLSWRVGFVVFHETLLSDAVAELNRYNQRQIVIDDSALSSMRIGGHFRSNNAEGFVRLLAEALPIRVEDDGGRIVLHHQ